MGQFQAKYAEAEEQKDALRQADRLLTERDVPRALQKQVEQHLLHLVAELSSSPKTTAPLEDLSLQGSTTSRHAAEHAVSFLLLAQQKKFSPATFEGITKLVLEREIHDDEALHVLAGFLQDQQQNPSSTHHQIDQLALSFLAFGASSQARESCNALLAANRRWRSIDLQHCNFVFEDDRSKTEMSFLTRGLQQQKNLEEFKLTHGMICNIPSVGDAEMAEVLNILATKQDTLRTLVMRDMYNDCSNASGDATTEALIHLLDTCQLERLVWDLPCTAELHKEGSDVQKRFLKAILQNETLLSVQLRRLSLNAPLAKQVRTCTRRNRNIVLARRSFSEHQPAPVDYPLESLLGAALGRLANDAAVDVAKQGRAARMPQEKPAPEQGTNEEQPVQTDARRVRFEPHPTYFEYEIGAAAARTRTTKRAAEATPTPWPTSREAPVGAVVNTSASAMYLVVRSTLVRI